MAICAQNWWKKNVLDKSKCPYVQPSSHLTHVRSVLAYMKEEYGWRFSLQKDLNFRGGLNPRMKELFADQEKEYPGLYGGGANKQIIRGNQTSGDLDLTVFNEDILEDHQQKC